MRAMCTRMDQQFDHLLFRPALFMIDRIISRTRCLQLFLFEHCNAKLFNRMLCILNTCSSVESTKCSCNLVLREFDSPNSLSEFVSYFRLQLLLSLWPFFFAFLFLGKSLMELPEFLN